MEYKNAEVIPVKPEMVKKGNFLELGKKVHEKRTDDYWLIMISPDGEIIIPKNNKFKAHGEMVRDVIMPADPILSVIFDYYHGEGAHLSGVYLIEMCNYGLYYGYINVDGHVFIEPDGRFNYEHYPIAGRYNPYALSTKTHYIIDYLQEYCYMNSSTNPKYSGEEEIALSKK